jgi:Uma2 family endonuclease
VIARISSAHAITTRDEEGGDMHVASETKPWTLEELHRLPDDGNKYELVRGELFVTPPPNETHENILTCLTRLLDRFVEANDLGLIFHPRAVMRFEGSEVEPDLMVRARHQPAVGEKDWDHAPIPILVVEVLSGSTRRRDHNQKRALYMDAGVEEYWIVDPRDRTIRSIRADREDELAKERLTWAPSRASESLSIELKSIFD